jgi:hypothetical protein
MEKMEKINLIPIKVIILNSNKIPSIELRCIINEPETIKTVVSAAFHSQPLTLMPEFTNKIRSLSSLMEKGVLYMEKGKYYFTF